MDKCSREIEKVYQIFDDLYNQNEARTDYEDSIEPGETEPDMLKYTLTKMDAIRNNMADYLRSGIDQLAQKRNWIYYIYLANFVFTKYNPAISDEFVAKYPFLNEVYSNNSSDGIVALLYNHPQLLTDLIAQYDTIEYLYQDEPKERRDDLSDVIAFYNKENPLMDTFEIQLTPHLYQNTALDLHLMHMIEDLPEEIAARNIYRMFYIHPEEIPNILNLPMETIKDNIPILNDELTLYTYIYLVCKKNALGLSIYENDLLGYIMGYLRDTEDNYTIEADVYYMISKYIHVLKNKHDIIKKHPVEIEEAVKLSRKKINGLSLICLYH